VLALAAIPALLVVVIIAFVARASAPALADIGLLRLFSDPGWHPTADAFNLWPMLAGSLAVMALALALALPLGLGCAVCLRFFAPPPASRTLRLLLALAAGVPSVVYGLWGLSELVPLIARWRQPGASLLAGAVVLALMVLPTIALTAEAALAAVPATVLRGAAALGLSRWGTVVGVALPAARRGIMAGTVLAAARALGETMGLLMVCGNVVQVPGSVFDPVRTLAANIVLEMAYATGAHRGALAVSGLVLLALVLALLLLVEQAPRRAHG